jgi:hypothetical protein
MGAHRLPDWVAHLGAEACAPCEISGGGRRAEIATWCLTFEALFPRRTKEERAAHWAEEYGKTIVRPRDGSARSVPEIEVVKAFREAGWGARWTDTFGQAPAWMHPWKRADVPKVLARTLSDIRWASPEAKPWDVIAWQGDEYLFVECKAPQAGRREPFTEAELAFFQGAAKLGIHADRFAVVLGKVDYPERT